VNEANLILVDIRLFFFLLKIEYYEEIKIIDYYSFNIKYYLIKIMIIMYLIKSITIYMKITNKKTVNN
jgi:hypothetical protein